MRERAGYVSNSSSSSFLVPKEFHGAVESIKLPKEIWKAIERNHVEWNGGKFDMSASDEWWLTEFVSDCQPEYESIAGLQNAISYLDGNDEPYGRYEDGGEKDYIVFRRGSQKFYVLASDFIDEYGRNDIPEAVDLRNGAKRILDSKSLNKTQKIDALKKLFCF